MKQKKIEISCEECDNDYFVLYDPGLDIGEVNYCAFCGGILEKEEDEDPMTRDWEDYYEVEE